MNGQYTSIQCPKAFRSRLVAMLLVASFLAICRPARAEETEGVSWTKANYNDYPGGKKVVEVGLVTVMGVTTVLSLIWMGRAFAAESHLKDFPQKTPGVADCKSAGECRELDQAEQDSSKRFTETAVLGLVAAGSGVAMMAVHILWPNNPRSVTVAPSATANGGSLSVLGTF